MKTETRAAGTRLAHIDLLKGLPAAELAALELRVGWQRFKSGEQILTKDSESRDAFLVVEGRVQIVNYSLTGREIAYATVPAGSYFGELSAIDGEPRSATVVAHTDCLLAAVPPEVFRECVLRHPSIALAVIQKLARIVRVCDDRIMDLSVLGAHQRVYGELLRLAKPDPITAGSWMIFPLPTQHDIAGLASTTRETVARVVSQLTHAGIVQRKGKTLYIRDRAKLQRLAERSAVGSADAP